MAGKSKEFSTEDVIGLLTQLKDSVASGNFQNTVIGTPLDSSAYDATAANANGMMQAYIGRYTNELLRTQKFMRQHAAAAALGAGSSGAGILETISRMNPALGNSIMGMPGADQAVRTMLEGAGGLAYASGRPMGGIMSPQQMATNVRWAATQGGMALSNAFNRDGSINGSFTYGLSLPQTSVVASSILSDSSQREEWARKELEKTANWRRENPNGTDEQRVKAGVMVEGQITGFKNGTTLTEAAVRSFNDHIKNFQKEMNGFVASVSKITGSFDTAIDFIQDMTNGKAFSSSVEAKGMRDKAMQTAASLRVMAADAGMDPKMLYNMMYNPIDGFGNVFEGARGRSPEASRVGDRSVSANIAALSAGAFAKWKQAHPNATEEESATAKERITSRVANFAKGDADEHNVLLAEAVRNGDLSEEEARRLASSGNQQFVYNKLKEIYGEDVDTIINDSVFMERFSKRNSPLVNDLNTLSMNKSFTREGVLMNQRGALRMSRKLAGKLSKNLGRDVSAEVADIHKKSIMDEGVLKAAGLSDDQIAELRKTTEGWGADAIHRHLVNTVGVDELELNRELGKKFGENLESAFGGNAAAARTIRQIREINAEASPEFRKEDLENYAAKGEVAKADKARRDLRNKYFDAKNRGDAAAEEKYLNEMTRISEESVSGRGETFYNNNDFMQFMLADAMRKDNVTNENDKKKIYATGLGKFIAGSDAKMSYDDTMKMVTDTLKGNLSEETLKAFNDPEKRMELFRKFRIQQGATAINAAVLNNKNLGIKQEDKQGLKEKFQDKFRNISAGEWKRYEKEADKENLTGMDREAFIAKRIAMSIMRGDDTLSKAGLTASAIEEISKKARTDEVAKAGIVHTFDNVATDWRKVGRRMDTSKLTAEQRREARMEAAARGSRDFISFAAQDNSTTDISDAYAMSDVSLGEDVVATVMASDSAMANEMNKPLGKLDSVDRAILRGKLGLDDKDRMKVLRGMFTDNSLAAKTGKSKEEIAGVFEKFLQDNEGVDDADLLDRANSYGAFSQFKGLGRELQLLSKSQDGQDNPLSMRKFMSAYINASKAKPEDMDKALENGVIMEAMRLGEVSDDRTLNVLMDIKKALEAMAAKVQ